MDDKLSFEQRDAHGAESGFGSAFSVQAECLVALVVAGLLFMAPVQAEVPGGSLAAPVCPPQAIAAGFSRLIFWQTFANLNAIDLTNSKVAGFSWYIGNIPWHGSSSRIDPAWFSSDGRVLTISSNNQYLGGYELATQTYLGAIGPRLVGLPTFAPGGYYEWTFAFDPAAQRVACCGWPALWLQDQQGTLAMADNNPSEAADYAEIDIFEAIPAGGNSIRPETNVIEWLNLNMAHQSPVAYPSFGSPDWSKFNTVGMLWKTRAENGGSMGVIQRYFNGSHLVDGDLKYTNSGDFAIVDSDNYILFMDTTNNWPLKVASVLVCQ